jgi:DNA polymerase-3 subunit delta'
LPLSPLDDDTVEVLLRRYCPELSNEDATALAAMGEGSVGRAIDLHSAGGLRHYQAMISLLRGLPKLDVVALHHFADAAIKGDDGFRITSTLFLWWLGRALAAAGRGDAPSEVVPGENALIRTLSGSAPLDQWFQVWEKVSRLFERTDAVNLDKKQVLISAFGSIERLVRPH